MLTYIFQGFQKAMGSNIWHGLGQRHGHGHGHEDGHGQRHLDVPIKKNVNSAEFLRGECAPLYVLAQDTTMLHW